MLLLNMPIVPENKALFVLFVYYLSNNKYKIMTKMFIFTHFGLNIHHYFIFFVTLKGFVFIIGILVRLHCSDKIVKQT